MSSRISTLLSINWGFQRNLHSIPKLHRRSHLPTKSFERSKAAFQQITRASATSNMADNGINMQNTTTNLTSDELNNKRRREISFVCSVCFEDRLEEQPRLINNDPVCRSCVEEAVVPLFHKAIYFEFHYPVEWSHGFVLDPHDFVEELGQHFVLRFERVEQEYNTKPADRIYCKRKILASDKQPPGMWRQRDIVWMEPEDVAKAEAEGKQVVGCGAFVCTRRPYGSWNLDMDGNAYAPVCRFCCGRVCPNCGEGVDVPSVFDFETDPPHLCVWEEPEKPEAALGGMQRGKDYQICAGRNCSSVVSLKDGCNFVRCPQSSCKTGMCFVCGDGPLEDHSNHWRTGGCPRYNHPDSRNAQYDDAADAAPEAAAGIGIPRWDEMAVEEQLEWIRQEDPNFAVEVEILEPERQEPEPEERPRTPGLVDDEEDDDWRDDESEIDEEREEDIQMEWEINMNRQMEEEQERMARAEEARMPWERPLPDSDDETAE